MNINDADFNDEYKPLHVPERYYPEASWRDKAVYALAVIGEGSAADVSGKMAELEESEMAEQLEQHAEEELNKLYEKGLLKGSLDGQVMRYNLSKEKHAHEGRVDPELLE